ncbi:hypothetical protein [Ruminococcus sp.]|uniref:hypothetical protein n=1 Tax=Ruminococcus sp. TaxID=41978 RepID=UPI002CE96E7C|nr:hypothetical protein [Ruminococcus sp.]HOA00279.1 hypothetical protein [Ruminococcus sp.]HOH86829.1 hypothetical protein [Ruminococcus sp.]
MKKFTKIAAFVFAVCLGATAMTACGDSKDDKKTDDKKPKASSIDDMDEEDLEAALNKLDEETSKELAKEKEEATEAETEPTTAAEIVYEPTEEIKNASFRSGYIQIGDTVFRNGGYITVSDFVDKYGDKFDMSEIVLDEYTTDSLQNAVITSIDDPRVKITISYATPGSDVNERSKISDCIVVGFNGHPDYCFYPTGIKSLDYDEVKSLLTELGLPEYTSEMDSLEPDWFKEEKDSFYVPIKAEEENLYGKCPTFRYEFFFNEKNLEGEKITLLEQFWKD